MSSQVGQPQSDAANDEQEDESLLSPSDAALGEMKRVTVTMHPEHHKSSKRIAEEHGFSFSGLVRRAVERHSQFLEDEGVEREMQPLVSALDRQQDSIDEQAEQIDTMLERLAELSEQMPERANSSQSQQPPTEIRERLWDVLSEEGAMTIPELQAETSLGREEVQRGLRALRDLHAVCEDDTPGDEIRWRCR